MSRKPMGELQSGQSVAAEKPHKRHQPRHHSSILIRPTALGYATMDANSTDCGDSTPFWVLGMVA